MAYGQTVSLSYTPGNVQSWYGGALAAFSDQSVTNNVVPSPPTVVSAATSTDGSYLDVNFNMLMANPPAAPAGFVVSGQALGEFVTDVANLGGPTLRPHPEHTGGVRPDSDPVLHPRQRAVLVRWNARRLRPERDQQCAAAVSPDRVSYHRPRCWRNNQPGQRSVSIPAGALQGTTGLTVTITLVSAKAPSGFEFLGSVYQFTVGGQDSYTFKIPVTLTFSFNPSQVPSGVSPAIYYYDDTTGQWVNIGGTVNCDNDTITTTVDHFTNYAVMYQTPGGWLFPLVGAGERRASRYCRYRQATSKG